jgi:anti-sigma regulatory factor (Ser/Thr protein kinase)
MKVSHQFPNDPAAVRAARRFALDQLEGYAAEQREVVELLVSELATNSVLHTDSGFMLSIESDRRKIRISVTDEGAGSPEVQDLDPQRLSGRGLALVEMFSSSWGVRPSSSAGDGKTVWLVLDTTEESRQAAPAARAGKRDAHPAGTPPAPRRRGTDGPAGVFLTRPRPRRPPARHG